MLVRYLQKIPVSRHQRDLQAVGLRFFCKRSQNVVRLQPLALHYDHLHGAQHVLHHRNLLPQLLRHGFSRPLVGLVHLMPEGGGVYVKRHRKILRFFLLQYSEHDIQESIHRIGVQSSCIAQIRHSVERPV